MKLCSPRCTFRSTPTHVLRHASLIALLGHSCQGCARALRLGMGDALVLKLCAPRCALRGTPVHALRCMSLMALLSHSCRGCARALKHGMCTPALCINQAHASGSHFRVACTWEGRVRRGHARTPENEMCSSKRHVLVYACSLASMRVLLGALLDGLSRTHLSGAYFSVDCSIFFSIYNFYR